MLLISVFKEVGDKNVIVNSGQVVEPTGRLRRILQAKADSGGTWQGLSISLGLLSYEKIVWPLSFIKRLKLSAKLLHVLSIVLMRLATLRMNLF